FHCRHRRGARTCSHGSITGTALAYSGRSELESRTSYWSAPSMAELIVKYPDRTAEHFAISRSRITIGRSARNDLCIPNTFASRVHAEVRHEGDEYFLHDLGSANGTLYNGSIVDTPVTP